MSRRMRAAALALFAILAAGRHAAADTNPPPPPTIVSLEPLSCDRLIVRWSNETDPSTGAVAVGSGLESYPLYLRPAGWSFAFPIGDFTGGAHRRRAGERSETISGVGGPFQIGVSARDRAGNASAITWSASVTLPPCGDLVSPAPPTGVAANLRKGYCARAEVSWNNDGKDAGAGMKSYKIFRDGILLDTRPVSANMRTEDNYGLAPGRTYRYTVTSVDRDGRESAPSAPSDLFITYDCSTVVPLGDKAVWAYYVVFADHPWPIQFNWQIDDMLFAGLLAPRNLRRFFLEASYGKATFHRASPLVGHWIALPRDTAYYCTRKNPSGEGDGCSTEKILADAVAATGVAPKDGDMVLLVVGGNSDQESGGRFVILNPNKSLDEILTVAAHEFSHSFGPQHSGTWDCSIYGWDDGPGADAFDPQFGCTGLSSKGDQYSPLGSGALAHQPAYIKRVMGFLMPENTRTAEADGTYSIGRLEAMDGYYIKDFRIPARKDPAAKDFLKPPFYALEYRTPTGYDGQDLAIGGTPFEGVLVRLVPDSFQGEDADTYLARKLTLAAGEDAFYDGRLGIGVKLVAMDGRTATVEVCGFAQTCPEDVRSAGNW